MPISTTLRSLDGGIYINADGLITDRHGIPTSIGGIPIKGGSGDPNGVTSADGPAVYIQTKLTPTGFAGIWVKPSGSTGNTGWEKSIEAS